MLTKDRSAQFKASDAKIGTFSAVVAVYGNVDSVGDRIVEGAFDRSLKSWQALGDPIPLILAHSWKDPFAHIGYVMPDKIKSVPGVGLVVEEGHLDMDNPTAAQVHRLMARKTLKEFSFGYGIPQGGQSKASDGAMDLRMLDLIELGPCLKGVNDKTELLSIKSQLEASRDESGVFTFEERLERLEQLLTSKAMGNARWRSQKRDPNTGKWVDELADAAVEDGAELGTASDDRAALDTWLQEEIGLPLDGNDKNDQDQVEGYLRDILSHAEMYPDDIVRAAEAHRSETPESEAASHDLRELQSMADELGEPVQDPNSGEWVQPEVDNADTYYESEDYKLGVDLAEMGDDDEDASLFLALVSDSLTHNMLGGEMYNPDGWQEMLSLEDAPSVKKLLQEPEIADAWKRIKKYGADNGWADYKDPGKSLSNLSLDDQISAMQSASAILAAEYDLESKGLAVHNTSDEVLQRLAELEEEML